MLSAGISGITDNNYIMILLNLGLVGFITVYMGIRMVVKQYIMALEKYEVWHLQGSFLFLLFLIFAAFFINIMEGFPFQIYAVFVLITPFTYNKQKALKIV